MHPWGRGGSRIQDIRDARVSGKRIGANERRHRTVSGAGGIEDDRSRLGLGKLLAITGIAQERDRAGVRVPEGGDALDIRIRITAQLASEADRELPERDRHVGAPERLGACPVYDPAPRRPHLPCGFGAGAAALPAAAGALFRAARIWGVMSSAGVA